MTDGCYRLYLFIYHHDPNHLPDARLKGVLKQQVFYHALLIIHYIRVIEEQLLLLICHSGIRSSFLVLGNQTERFFKFIPFASWHGIVTQY